MSDFILGTKDGGLNKTKQNLCGVCIPVKETENNQENKCRYIFIIMNTLKKSKSGKEVGSDYGGRWESTVLEVPQKSFLELQHLSWDQHEVSEGVVKS